MLIGLSSCKIATIPNFYSQPKPQIPNYNKESAWAVLPTNYPKILLDKQSKTTNLAADVFYIYPTLNIEKKDLRWNVPISDTVQNEKVINTAVNFQASAFINAGKLYVPYYRQAHIRSYLNLENGGESALNLAYSDVKLAFEIYLEKYNNGRPIIIASHSQGTTHAIRLLKDFFDNKELQTKLIAAYLPGISIDKDEFETICLMTEPTETGGFVSWNTFKKNYYPKNYSKWFEGNAVSNPITWDTEIISNRIDHKGFLFRNNTIYEQALEVFVKDGILWTSLPHFPFRIFLMGKKNYHVGDINLFWEDINTNAVLRVKTFFNAKD
jgi:hypothetical protein